jgi:GGDEF domain-containing protein
VIPWARRGPTGALLLLAAQPRGLLEADDESTATLARAAIVQRLAGTLRGSDFQVALGGGEFAVVLEATSPQEATPVVERLRRIIHSVDARGAIGVVPIDGSQDAAGVLASARAALAQAQATAATGDALD